MEKMYLVKYHTAQRGFFFSETIFVTTKKSTAVKYVDKFNRILKKWKKYYSQFEETRIGFTWIKEEYVEQHFNRWDQLRDIDKCFYEEAEVR